MPITTTICMKNVDSTSRSRVSNLDNFQFFVFCKKGKNTCLFIFWVIFENAIKIIPPRSLLWSHIFVKLVWMGNLGFASITIFILILQLLGRIEFVKILQDPSKFSKIRQYSPKFVKYWRNFDEFWRISTNLILLNRHIGTAWHINTRIEMA